MTKTVENAESAENPKQHDQDDHHIQDRLDLAVHRDHRVDEIKTNTGDDQQDEKLCQSHELEGSRTVPRPPPSLLFLEGCDLLVRHLETRDESALSRLARHCFLRQTVTIFASCPPRFSRSTFSESAFLRGISER